MYGLVGDGEPLVGGFCGGARLIRVRFVTGRQAVVRCFLLVLLVVALATPTSAVAQCVDINSASIPELRRIIHIDEVRAPKVVQHRPYTSVDQLTRVKGIGPARVADIRQQGLACVR